MWPSKAIPICRAWQIVGALMEKYEMVFELEQAVQRAIKIDCR